MKLGEYHFSNLFQRFALLMGLAMAAGSFAVVITSSQLGPVLRVCLLFVGLSEGVWIVFAALKSKAVLYSDAIEVYGAFKMRRMDKRDIVKKTVGVNGSILLWSDRRRFWPFQVSTWLVTDRVFQDWMDSVSELKKRGR